MSSEAHNLSPYPRFYNKLETKPKTKKYPHYQFVHPLYEKES